MTGYQTLMDGDRNACFDEGTDGPACQLGEPARDLPVPDDVHPWQIGGAGPRTTRDLLETARGALLDCLNVAPGHEWHGRLPFDEASSGFTHSGEHSGLVNDAQHEALERRTLGFTDRHSPAERPIELLILGDIAQHDRLARAECRHDGGTHLAAGRPAQGDHDVNGVHRRLEVPGREVREELDGMGGARSPYRLSNHPFLVRVAGPAGDNEPGSPWTEGMHAGEGPHDGR